MDWSTDKDVQTKEEDVQDKDEGDTGTADLFAVSEYKLPSFNFGTSTTFGHQTLRFGQLGRSQSYSKKRFRLDPLHDPASVSTAPVNTAPSAKKSSIKTTEEEGDEESYQAGTMYLAVATREYIKHLERAVQGGPKEFSDPEIERLLHKVLKVTLQNRHKTPTTVTSQVASKKLGQSTESRAGGDGPSTATGSPSAPTTVTDTMTPSNATAPRRMSMMAIPSYGDHSIGSTPEGSNRAAWYSTFYPQVQSTPGSRSLSSVPVTTSTTPTAVIPAIVPAGTSSTTGDSTHNVQMVAGIPTELRNAVKVILPFQSEKASYERAAAFWRSNSRIENFRQLKDRFHNRFLSQTPAQMWNRLKSAKRNRDESAEEWGDRIFRLCEALNYNEPRMQYEFFYDGIRNKKMRAVLNASMASSIEEACTLLLYKNVHLPVEEDDEFAEMTTTSVTKGGSAKDELLHETQRLNMLLLQQQQNSRPAPRSPRPNGRINTTLPTPATTTTLKPYVDVLSAKNATTVFGQPCNVVHDVPSYGPLHVEVSPDERIEDDGFECGYLD
ncbi:hypothetical protein PHMEG_00021089 [Phytophthora megakarya]|uniref:Retrotransposon gag domain-containing protein n=1 Tax=Phytophthora megakarya TaxID=4795 RepID=A0A225VMS0_9STRA|nr:hypothetical protein PHMEG_00021089 [Phytophthora megakarya]